MAPADGRGGATRNGWGSPPDGAAFSVNRSDRSARFLARPFQFVSFPSFFIVNVQTLLKMTSCQSCQIGARGGFRGVFGAGRKARARFSSPVLGVCRRESALRAPTGEEFPCRPIIP